MTNVQSTNPVETALYFLNLRLVMAVCWLAGVLDYARAALGLAPAQGGTVDRPPLSFKLQEDHYWIGGAALLAFIAPAVLL